MKIPKDLDLQCIKDLVQYLARGCGNGVYIRELVKLLKANGEGHGLTELECKRNGVIL